QALSEALRSSFFIVKILMVLMVFVFLGSGFFTVGPQQKAVILRFGKPVGEPSQALLGAGLHWAYPYPIDEVVKIPITEIQTVRSTVGWFYLTPEQALADVEPPAGPSLNPAMDGYTITGDQNIIHTRATLYYRISDPIRHVFGFVNASNAVQNALDNALVYVSARYKVDDALTRDITGFKEKVQERVTELANAEKLGILVEQCQVESRPARQLKKAFDDVLLAVSTAEKTNNEALSYQNQILSRASAEATNRINTAESERVRLVASVKAEAERFTKMLPQYDKNPLLFTQVMLNEKLGQVLGSAQKFYVPEGGKPWELRLQLNREPPKPQTP
ncbi:MAG TPA: protease modulator HflK, partial [Verrucomicrobiae bacterium]|nr:protease modulator HflK [Verrucomicrobiae bacterium]